MDHGGKDLYTSIAGYCRKLQTEEEDSRLQVSASFSFPPDYCGFDGHFPGQAVLPAVVQLAMIRYLAETVLHRSLWPVQYGKVKFKGMIRPADTFVVDADIRHDGDGWQSTFRIRTGEGKPITEGLVDFLSR